MGEINRRIKKIREKEGISRTKFAELIGTTERKIQNVEQELQRVQDDLIESIIKKFPQYAYWLVTGQTIPEAGQISPDDAENVPKRREIGNENDKQQQPDDFDHPALLAGSNRRYHRPSEEQAKSENR